MPLGKIGKFTGSHMPKLNKDNKQTVPNRVKAMQTPTTKGTGMPNVPVKKRPSRLK